MTTDHAAEARAHLTNISDHPLGTDECMLQAAMAQTHALLAIHDCLATIGDVLDTRPILVEVRQWGP